MDNTTAVAAAAVGATVAIVTHLVVDRVKKVRDLEKLNANLDHAYFAGRQQGYYEGRESVLQQFASTVTPQDFAPAS
jgi:hypothetical protein